MRYLNGPPPRAAKAPVKAAAGPKVKRRYYYNGGVVLFDREITRWSGSTLAVSEAQARSNITYQVKRGLDLPMRSPLTLTGRLSLAAPTKG